MLSACIYIHVHVTDVGINNIIATLLLNCNNSVTVNTRGVTSKRQWRPLPPQLLNEMGVPLIFLGQARPSKIEE